jgi:hypothetical protein
MTGRRYAPMQATSSDTALLAVLAARRVAARHPIESVKQAVAAFIVLDASGMWTDRTLRQMSNRLTDEVKAQLAEVIVFMLARRTNEHFSPPDPGAG